MILLLCVVEELILLLSRMCLIFSLLSVFNIVAVCEVCIICCHVKCTFYCSP